MQTVHAPLAERRNLPKARFIARSNSPVSVRRTTYPQLETLKPYLPSLRSCVTTSASISLAKTVWFESADKSQIQAAERTDYASSGVPAQ